MNYFEYLGIKIFLSNKPIKHWLFHENEFWKEIEGYEGMYQISSLGRVKSLERVKIKKTGAVQNVEEKIRKQCKDPEYSIVSLSFNGKCLTKKIHKLVMDAFKGKSPLQVNHKDFNRQNNRLSNLEHCSNQQNSIHYHKSHPRTSRFVGVSFDKARNKWRASINLNNNWVNLGRHKTEIGAYVARLKYEIKMYAEGVLK